MATMMVSTLVLKLILVARERLKMKYLIVALMLVSVVLKADDTVTKKKKKKIVLIPPITFSPQNFTVYRHDKERPEEKSSLGGDIGIHYFEGMGSNPLPGILVTPDLIYQINHRYSIAAEMDYRSPFDPPPNDRLVGWQDLDLTLSNDNFYTNDLKTFNISGHIDGYLPTSQKSQDDSMIAGGSLDLGLTYKTGAFKFKLDNAIYGYSYVYLTQLGDTDYNPSMSVMNRLGLDIELFKDFKFKNSFSLWTFQDYGGNTQNVYMGTSGVSYAFGKVTADFYYKFKNGELNDITLLDGENYTLNTGLAYHF